MKKTLKLNSESDPSDALDLPEGRLVLSMFQASFSPEDVLECAQLIVDKGDVDVTFVSQAGIIAYAGNNLGFGTGEGYKTV